MWIEIPRVSADESAFCNVAEKNCRIAILRNVLGFFEKIFRMENAKEIDLQFPHRIRRKPKTKKDFMNTRKEGFTGEEMAARFLKKRGYKILERNFSSTHGEIDIVAKDKNFIVFVEVKRRKSEYFGAPEEAVTPLKQKSIINCAKVWLVQNKLYGSPVRFDVVSIMREDITLLKDAFRA